MKQVQAFLVAGEGVKARQRLTALLAEEPGLATASAEVIASILWNSYELFHVQATHDFCRELEFELPAVVADRIQQTLGPRIQRTADWEGRLRAVTRERLVRECRDFIIHKELKRALASAVALLERATDESELDDSSVLLARGLATLQRDRDHALQVIGHLMRSGVQARQAAPIVADQFTQMSREFKTTTFENTSTEWSQHLTEAVLTFRAYLPGPMEAGEPEIEQLASFYEEAHACLRAGLHHRDRDDFIDALSILAEFCPTDPPLIKNAAGVEGRMFLNLGPRAKLTAVRGLGKLGELEPLRKALMALAHDSALERTKLFSSMMGGLRHPDFYPYLRHMLAKADNRRDEALAIEGLGRVGNPESIKLLLAMLETALKKSTDPVQEQRVYLLLTALGRIARFKGVDPLARVEIIKKITKLTDRSERKLAFHAASELFRVRLDELPDDQKNWAAHKAVDAMWGQPTSQPDTPSVNGWREPMVDTLRRLGPQVLPAVLAAAGKHAARYSGAMGALANALEEIGDERAVSLLESMLRVAFLHDDDPHQSRLLEEKTVDAATGLVRTLDRDEVIHALLYALKKIGEEAGIKVILDYADRVQGGRLQAPGQQTINLLLDAKLHQGRLDLQQAQAVAAVVDEKAFRQALSNARGGLLTRKNTQIAAIAQLGQMKRNEGMGVLLEALGNKDPMIASAAHTSLAQFLTPLPAEKPYSEFLATLLERPGALKGRLLERFLAFVNRELPKNPPFDRLLERQVEIMVDDGELAHRLRGAMRRPKDKDPLERLKSQSFRGEEEGEPEPEERSIFIDDDRLTRQTDLDKRRAYFEARRAWVQGGKVGEPPKPPQ